MRKKYLLSLLIMACFLVACANNNVSTDLETQEELQDMDDNHADFVSESQNDENDIKKNTQVLEEIIPEENVEKKETVLPSDDVVDQMLDSFIDYMALAYIENRYDFTELSDEVVFGMTGFAANHFSEGNEMDEEYRYIVPMEDYREALKDLFSLEYREVINGDYSIDVLEKKEDGFHLCAGDWGEEQPRYEITDVSLDENEPDKILISARFYMIEYSINEEYTSGCHANAIYTLEESEDSKFGYVISGMLFEKID